MQYLSKMPHALLGQDHLGPVEWARLAKSDDKNALSMLRDEVLRVDHLIVNRVAELLFEHVTDHPKGVALVVTDEVLDVLEKERARPLRLKDAGHVEEQRSLRLAREAMRPSEGVFLRHPGDRERLARKPSEQHVEIGHLPHRIIELRDVAEYLVGVLLKVRAVSLLTEHVPLAREHALAADGLNAEPNPSDASEKVREGEEWLTGRHA